MKRECATVWLGAHMFAVAPSVRKRWSCLETRGTELPAQAELGTRQVARAAHHTPRDFALLIAPHMRRQSKRKACRTQMICNGACPGARCASFEPRQKYSLSGETAIQISHTISSDGDAPGGSPGHTSYVHLKLCVIILRYLRLRRLL